MPILILEHSQGRGNIEMDVDPVANSGIRSSARGSATGPEFDLPKALKRPRDVSYSVQSLYGDMARGLLDLDVEYQRDVVWKTEKQMMLIDSVFTNHYIPPLIIAVIYDENNGSEIKKICLDGKQRLTSLKLFMDGLIPLKHPDTMKNWWYKVDESTTTSRAKNILPERVRVSFANRQIRCTEYEDLDEEDEREIFRRVQLGVALSSAEKLRVLNTRRAKFINELRDLYVTEHGLAAPSFRWDRSRGADYRCLAQAVFVISKWGSDNGASLKNAGTLPQVEKWLEDDNEPVAADFGALIKKTFSVLVELTTNAEYSVPFQMYTKVSPIEIIGVLVLVYAHFVTAPHSSKLTLPALSAAVTQMRQHVRREHKDIRLNDRVGKTIIAFVKNYRLPIPTSPPLTATPSPEVHPTPSAEPSTCYQPMDIDTFPSSSSTNPLLPLVPTPSKRKREGTDGEQSSPKRLTNPPFDRSLEASISSIPAVGSLRHGMSSIVPRIVSYPARDFPMAPESSDLNRTLAHGSHHHNAAPLSYRLPPISHSTPITHPTYLYSHHTPIIPSSTSLAVSGDAHPHIKTEPGTPVAMSLTALRDLQTVNHMMSQHANSRQRQSYESMAKQG